MVREVVVTMKCPECGFEDDKVTEHVREMLSAYVGPMREALVALAERVEKIEGSKHGA